MDYATTSFNANVFSPLIIYESVTNSPSRCANIKNFTLFNQDLANGVLPQWIFITPNMSKFFFFALEPSLSLLLFVAVSQLFI